MRDTRRHLATASLLLLVVILAACGQTTAAATPEPTPTPVPTPAGGAHQFTVGDPQVVLTVTLPPGWEADASSAHRTASDGSELAISAWVPTSVYADPCQWQGTDVAVGPTAADFVAALAAQPMHRTRDATVKIADLTAQMLFVTVADSVDFSTCDDGQFRMWTGASASEARIGSAAGETDEVYAIEVGGRVVVLDLAYSDASTDELAEMHRIIQSLQLPLEPSPTPAAS